MEASIISITTDGRQLTASGYTTIKSVMSHILERVRHNDCVILGTKYSGFVTVITDLVDGKMATKVTNLDARGQVIEGSQA